MLRGGRRFLQGGQYKQATDTSSGLEGSRHTSRDDQVKEILCVTQRDPMPKIRTTRTKTPPEGFEEVESVSMISYPVYNPVASDALSQILDDYAKKMRDAENESHEGKRKAESLWPIMRISHARSRYIYELYYKREAISRELYDWLLKEGYADAKCVQWVPRSQSPKTYLTFTRA